MCLLPMRSFKKSLSLNGNHFDAMQGFKQRHRGDTRRQSLVRREEKTGEQEDLLLIWLIYYVHNFKPY